MKAQPKKPHLMEIFAAFNGIGYAAMGVLDTPGGTLSDPLCMLERHSSNLRYKLRQDILDNMNMPDQDVRQALAANQALDFLRSARPTLKAHSLVQLVGASSDARGGMVGDVIADIDDLLAREAKGTERALVTSKGGGELFPRVKRDYFPGVPKDLQEKAVAEIVPNKSVSDDQEIRQATARKGSRKKTSVFQETFTSAQVDKPGTIVKTLVSATAVPADVLSL